MLIISYEKGVLGGYGDRIVGLISIYVLSEILKTSFRLDLSN